jgi:O-antigen/teichoic acid export membrane protein
MAFSARGQVLGRVALVATTAALLWFEVGVVAVFVGQVLDGLITFAVTFALFRRVVGTRGFQTSLSAVRALTREALPFGLNALFGSVYLSVDVLLLAMMKGDTEVGVYRGAVMLISLFPVVANTLTTGVYPRMARHVGHPDRAGAELRFVHRVLLAISVPAAVGGMLLAEPLMVFIGGDAFAVSALPFLILCPLLPLRFVNNGSAMTLSTLDRQGDRTRGVMLAAALNLAANFVVIPTYGAAGAAATTLATEVALALWFRWRIGPLVEGLGLPQNVARAAAPAAAMAAALWALPDWHVVAQVAVGAAVFAAVGLVSGAWHPRDLKQLRSV